MYIIQSIDVTVVVKPCNLQVSTLRLREIKWKVNYIPETMKKIKDLVSALTQLQRNFTGNIKNKHKPVHTTIQTTAQVDGLYIIYSIKNRIDLQSVYLISF